MDTRQIEAGELSRFDATETHMGTAFTIVLYARDQTTANDGFRAAFARIAELDQKLSDYSSSSEISQLSAGSPHKNGQTVSNDLWTVLSTAQNLSEETDGAFDVSVGPLTKLWRRARRRNQMPDAKLLKHAKEAVGYRKVRLDWKEKSIQLTAGNMRIDLGGIAKGYALDEAINTLKQKGITQAFVNGGGDIATSEPPPGKSGWYVKLSGAKPNSEDERREPNEPLWIVLANNAVATSGDAWQFVEINGKRYSHLVDPKTGLGLTLSSTVSVVAPTGIEADSLASAISVLGPVDGMKLVETKQKTAARVVTIEQNRIRDRRSARFQQFVQSKALPPAKN